MVRIEDVGDPLTDEQVQRLEQQLGGSLPRSYRDFLLKYNGGRPCPDTVDVDHAPGTPTDLQLFFGLGAAIESSDLAWNKRVFAERLPERLLPIACDSGGNLFCISLSSEDTGAVFYVDLEQGRPANYLVAGDFAGLLEKIREFDGAPDQPNRSLN